MPADARYPLLVKVREGFGSRHIYRADDREQLEFYLRATPVDSMVQERCLGEEFSIDVFCDTGGRCLNAIPRSMIQSKGGESIKGESLQDRELIDHGARVAETIGIVGPANVQCFREPDGSLPLRTSTRGSAGRSRCRSRRAAGIRSSPSPSRAARRRRRASGSSGRAS